MTSTPRNGKRVIWAYINWDSQVQAVYYHSLIGIILVVAIFTESDVLTADTGGFYKGWRMRSVIKAAERMCSVQGPFSYFPRNHNGCAT